MQREFAVIGLGRFGTSVALTLYDLGHSVLGIDDDESKVQALANRITHVVQADATDEAALRSLGLRNFDTVIVAIGQDLEASILITLMLKEMGVRNVVGKAATDVHGKVLARVGADRVVFPEKDMGQKTARFLAQTNLLDYIELTPDISLVELSPAGFEGKSLRDLDLRARFHVTVVAIRRGKEVIISPPADDPLRRDDIVVAVGKNENINKLQEFQEKGRR